jgi:hypothetical protein
MRALLVEAMRKAAVAWLEVAGQPAYPVWCLWHADALYVVSGPGEQPAPALASAATALVTARGDHGGAIITWAASVERIEPASEAWAEVAPLLAAKRLNSLPAPALTARWAAANTVSRLTPAAPTS